MKRESSGRLLLTSDVAKMLGIETATVRQQILAGKLKPDHVSPGGVSIFYVETIESHIAKLALRDKLRAKVDEELGFRPAPQMLLNVNGG
jgi:hypothetical protein